MSANENYMCSCSEGPESQSIVVNRTDSNFSRAAVKVLLDNIVAPEDIESIFKTDTRLKCGGKTGGCEFCNKRCNNCQLCCSNKGLQLYLLNKALEKINCIPSRCQSIFCKANQFARCNATCSEKCKKQFKAICKDMVNVTTFKTLKARLKNIRKYYPYIYKYKGNIIEEWGRNEMLCKMKPEVVNFNSKNTPIFWI